ncbi:MAG: hypothetical protein HFF86_05125 [Oscillibacter sp.]|nr:hypothetical protein [Oscillibacter sp.]
MEQKQAGGLKQKEDSTTQEQQSMINSVIRMLYLADQRKLSNIYHFVLHIL